MQPFHLAIPINNIEETQKFYTNILQCKVGRSTDQWIDFDFFGHQLSAHVKPEETTITRANMVDGESVPVRHFGVVLKWEDWHILAEELRSNNSDFIIEPTIRFKGKIGEQATMFFS